MLTTHDGQFRRTENNISHPLTPEATSLTFDGYDVEAVRPLEDEFNALAFNIMVSCI